MKMSELQRKDVVSINDGKIIGKIIDADINSDTGLIDNFIVEKSRYLRNIFTSDTLVDLKYSNIKKIGTDVVLIEL